MSDLIRGQIIGIRSILELPEAIDQFEANKKKYQEIIDNINKINAEGANNMDIPGRGRNITPRGGN